ncbi:unnamed protein product [Schistocephalus solidus]|uniref:Uncharacterized protein n=1 Tax=Schistocephalus solidus TaxID=70667 RepID=A0A183SPV2_SCHSO|nr:unnamed protein product [Schistocephalus solidus]
MEMTKPHLGDDEAVIRTTVGTRDPLCHQHVLLISPPDEDILQKVSIYRPGVHPGRVLPHREAEEGVGQNQTVFGAVLGRARRQNQDWFDDNDGDISNLLAEKNGLHKAYMDIWTDATKAAFFRCRRLGRQRLREMQDAWMIRKAEEIQGSALNFSSAISDAAIDRLPQVDTNNDLDLPTPLPETIWAVQQISIGKAPRSNAILPEVYKHG